MSVENFPYRGVDRPGKFQAEPTYRRNFDNVRASYYRIVQEIRAGRRLPPGRLFMSSHDFSGMERHGIKFNYAPFVNGVINDLKVTHEGYIGIEDEVDFGMSLADLYVGVREIRPVFSDFVLSSDSLADTMVGICASPKFPANLYGANLETSRDIRSSISLALRLLKMSLDSLSELNIDAGITHIPFMRSQQISTDGIDPLDVSQWTEVMAVRFSNGFDAFLDQSPAFFSNFGVLLKNYRQDLENLLEAYSLSYIFKNSDVSVFDMVGPYVFLDVILKITKHAVELRESLHLVNGMLSNS